MTQPRMTVPSFSLDELQKLTRHRHPWFIPWECLHCLVRDLALYALKQTTARSEMGSAYMVAADACNQNIEESIRLRDLAAEAITILSTCPDADARKEQYERLHKRLVESRERETHGE